MTSTTKISTIKKYIGIAVAVIFWLGLWQLASEIVGKELLLPSPLSVLNSLCSLASSAAFWQSIFLSLLRVLCGIIVGITAGIILAALSKISWLLNAIISPLIRIVRATPVASFIILALLWIGKASIPAFISMLMVTPVVWGNIMSALEHTPTELLEMAHCYHVSRFKTILHIYIPSAAPSFISACTTSIGLAWKSGIAAEVLCLPRNAIGTKLYYSRVYLETSSLFAWTLVVIILSFIFELGFKLFTKRRHRQ